MVMVSILQPMHSAGEEGDEHNDVGYRRYLKYLQCRMHFFWNRTMIRRMSDTWALSDSLWVSIKTVHSNIMVKLSQWKQMATS